MLESRARARGTPRRIMIRRRCRQTPARDMHAITGGEIDWRLVRVRVQLGCPAWTERMN